jgi:hypothetical protein
VADRSSGREAHPGAVVTSSDERRPPADRSVSSPDASSDGRPGADDELLRLLRAIGELEELPGVADNEAVARRLGWASEHLDDRLAHARDRLLVWGVRVGGRPGPRYVDLELTVQGRRLLRAGPVAGAGGGGPA